MRSIRKSLVSLIAAAAVVVGMVATLGASKARSLKPEYPADALPPSLCSPPTQPTGTPVHLDFLGIDHQFRITETR